MDRLWPYQQPCDRGVFVAACVMKCCVSARVLNVWIDAFALEQHLDHADTLFLVPHIKGVALVLRVTGCNPSPTEVLAERLRLPASTARNRSAMLDQRHPVSS